MVKYATLAINAVNVKCVGRGAGDGCGFVGGASGDSCPSCGGMLLSDAAAQQANALAERWTQEDSIRS